MRSQNEFYKRTLAISELFVQRLMEKLRLERTKKYGKLSERLSDLQLELLGHEPAEPDLYPAWSSRSQRLF